jgi:hypothetical protein
VACKQPIAFEALIAYWLGELPREVEEPLEEHLFACASCSARLEELAALAEGIRAVVRQGRVAAVISAPFIEALRRQGLRIREYAVPPGGRVECTMRAEDDAVVSRMQAPLAGVKRVDLLQRVEVDGEVSEFRLEDVPFDPAASEVLTLPLAPAELRKMPAHTARMRLVAVEETGERELGQYVFAHTPG